MNNQEKIDFVMIWVDGSDPEWAAEKRKYKGITSTSDGNVDDAPSRYQDWGILKYWFRGVEKFAPWVNKVYFVTCGHVPSWLNLNAEKIVHVKHSDYMPEEYLPTFSSHPIELNIHRIQGLSDKIVYFNDDMFIIRPVSPDLFFRKGLPVHPARIHPVLPRDNGGVMPHIYVNMTEVINQEFDYHAMLKRNWKIWFNPGAAGIRDTVENLYCYNFEQLPGFGNEHLPVPILKSTIEEVWEKRGADLDKTSRHRFRSEQDVSQYLFRYWQLASGRFVPVNRRKLGGRITIKEDNRRIVTIIRRQSWPMLCINDMGETRDEDFESIRDEMIGAFENILPERSSFETK